MHYDEIIETLKEVTELTKELKKQDDGFVEENNKASKRNAELTQQINKLTQENDKLKTKNDSLCRELNQSSYKIRDDKHEIHQLKGMLENKMADTALDKKAIDGLEGIIADLTEHNDILLQKQGDLTVDLNRSKFDAREAREANDKLIDENEDLRAQRDCYKKDNDKLKKAVAKLSEQNDQLIEQVYQDEIEAQEVIAPKERHPHFNYRYSYGQLKMFESFSKTHDISESTLHKLYEALLKLEDGFDPDVPSAAEIGYKNLIESIEHLVSRHVLSRSLTEKLNKEGGE